MNSKPTIKIEQPSAGADWTHTAAIAIGNGDAPIPPYLVFATERGYVPPLVLLTNDELKRGAATSRGYLDFQFRPDWASQERPWERWLEAICWLSLDEFLPALAKLCFLVMATLCAAISTKGNCRSRRGLVPRATLRPIDCTGLVADRSAIRVAQVARVAPGDPPIQALDPYGPLDVGRMPLDQSLHRVRRGRRRDCRHSR